VEIERKNDFVYDALLIRTYTKLVTQNWTTQNHIRTRRGVLF